MTEKGIRYKILDKMLDTQIFCGDATDDGNLGAKPAQRQTINFLTSQQGYGNRFSGIYNRIIPWLRRPILLDKLIRPDAFGAHRRGGFTTFPIQTVK
jgi:hypothetical protein